MADSSSDDNPWKTLSSELKYANPWIEVAEHRVVNPNGGRGIYGTVHFKNIAIGVLPLDDAGNVWLVGQYRYTLGRYSWEIPEGGGALAVDPLESAKRELKEETGIEAAHWRRLLEMDMSNSVTDERAIIYLATELSFGAADPEETESLAVRRVPLDEVYRRVLDGEIRDSIAVAGILRLRLLLDEPGT